MALLFEPSQPGGRQVGRPPSNTHRGLEFKNAGKVLMDSKIGWNSQRRCTAGATSWIAPSAGRLLAGSGCWRALVAAIVGVGVGRPGIGSNLRNGMVLLLPAGATGRLRGDADVACRQQALQSFVKDHQGGDVGV